MVVDIHNEISNTVLKWNSEGFSMKVLNQLPKKISKTVAEEIYKKNPKKLKKIKQIVWEISVLIIPKISLKNNFKRGHFHLASLYPAFSRIYRR